MNDTRVKIHVAMCYIPKGSLCWNYLYDCSAAPKPPRVSPEPKRRRDNLPVISQTMVGSIHVLRRDPDVEKIVFKRLALPVIMSPPRARGMSRTKQNDVDDTTSKLHVLQIFINYVREQCKVRGLRTKASLPHACM